MNYNINSIYDPDLPPHLNDFLNYLGTIKGKSENTIYGYKTDLIMFFKFIKMFKKLIDVSLDFDQIKISDVDLKFIKAISLQDLYAFISFAENLRGNGNSAKARKVASLKSFYKYLQIKAKVIKDNPAAELEAPKLRKSNPIYLSLEESKDLLNSIEGKFERRDYCIITLFLNCGMRLSELCGINLNKIKDDTLTVIGKGNKERTIYLNSMCLEAINDYMFERNAMENKIIDKDALFISKNYRRINKRSVELIVEKYIVKSGLDKDMYSPHKLRHTAATLMYKHGNVDIRSLQQILGHESVSTTEIYTHLDDDKLRNAVKSNPLNE